VTGRRFGRQYYIYYFCFLIGFLACDPGEAPTQAVALHSETRPQQLRVVSLTPTASKFLIALDATDLLVGVDDQSAALPDLGGLPIVDLEASARLAPDVVLVSKLETKRDGAVGQPDSIEFAPHDLEDLFALIRDVGSRLVGGARARRFERELARPLAAIGGSSFGQRRLRVIAVVGFDPIELAGGHSFETDLIEIAGGISVTHGGEEPRLTLGADRFGELAPDLILVVRDRAPTPEQRKAALGALPDEFAIEFFVFDREHFWLQDSEATAKRLRALLIAVGAEPDSPPVRPALRGALQKRK
jgi:ABC-type hemin transport system substrate-binding protein